MSGLLLRIDTLKRLEGKKEKTEIEKASKNVLRGSIEYMELIQKLRSKVDEDLSYMCLGKLVKETEDDQMEAQRGKNLNQETVRQHSIV